MEISNQSAGNCASLGRLAKSSDELTNVGAGLAPAFSSLKPTLPHRAGHLVVGDLIDLYMAQYAGRDMTRTQRLGWWKDRIGAITLQELSDDEIHEALEDLSGQQGRFFAGKDADGKAIYKARKKPISPATINRYNASLGAVITWSIKRRIAPKGYVHPCRAIERLPENNEKTRYLSDKEREALLAVCRESRWARLYLIVLLALTTGARRSELVGLRWRDIDFDRALAHVAHTKNGDPRMLPLVPAAIECLQRLAGAPSGLIFPSARKPDQPYDFEACWQDALRNAKVRNFRFHDLRHTCASMLAQSGASLLQIGDLLGHRQLQVTKRYSHLATDHKAKLVNRVLGEVR